MNEGGGGGGGGERERNCIVMDGYMLMNIKKVRKKKERGEKKVPGLQKKRGEGRELKLKNFILQWLYFSFSQNQVIYLLTQLRSV